MSDSSAPIGASSSSTPTVSPSAPMSVDAPAANASPTIQSSEKSSIEASSSKNDSGKTDISASQITAVPNDGKSEQKFKVKVDGKEIEVTQEELTRDYQLRQASHAKFKEASEKMKQINQFLDLLKTDPRRVLTHPDVGLDPRKLGEQWIAEALEEELLDPKDKELRDLKARLAEKEAREKDAEAKANEARNKEMIDKYSAEYSNQISSALQSSGLPVNQKTAERVRDYMIEALDAGYEVSAKDVIPFVKEDYQNDIKALFSASPAQMLADLLGEDKLKEIRKWDMERVNVSAKKASGAASGVPEQSAPKADRVNAEKPKLVSTYFEELNKKFSS